MADDFANHPVSITEAKGKREENAALWTPRDALINMLRRIDEGEFAPTSIVIMWEQDDPERRTSGYSNAGPNRTHVIGLVERVKHMMLGD